MAFRNIIIENPANISVKNNQLVIRTDESHSVPMEDISALLLESRQSSVSTAALSALAKNGCAVYICDEKHMPSAVITPFMQHSRGPDVLERQLELGEVKKKHLWKQVVTQKILNQATALRINGNISDSKELVLLASRVKSGDAGNMEAIAAAKYFRAFFEPSFTRREENYVNSALNYGYAILRGCMARTLAVYGFIPEIGIHHHNEYNSFSLADDLMEPFRPVVDLMVGAMDSESQELESHDKKLLFNCLNLDVISGGQRHSVAFAMERLVKSFSTCLHSDSEDLMLPILFELHQHTYG